MKSTCILSLREKQIYNLNFCNTSIQIFKRLVQMGLGEDINFDEFLKDL